MAAGIVLLIAAILLGAAGIVAPVYLNAIAVPVAQEIGAAGPTMVEEAGLLLTEGKYGPAWRIERARQQLNNPTGPSASADPGRFPDQLHAFIHAHPEDALIGGAEAYGQQFLKMAPKTPRPDPGGEPVPFAHLLAQRENREALRRLLAGSRNQNVQTILSTEDLRGVRQFMPVASAAGAPLESAVLTTALLAQSGFLGPEFSREIELMGRRAMDGDPAAVARLEAFYLSALGAARRLDWASLGAWARSAPDPVTFMRATTLLRRSGERENLVFAITQLTDRPDWLADYYEKWGDASWTSLEPALLWGPETVRYLLEQQLPLHQPPVNYTGVPDRDGSNLAWIQFCGAHRELALLLKGLALILSGVLFASGLKTVLVARAELFERRAPGMALLQNGLAGVVLLLLIVTWQEPRLFAQPVTEPGALFLEFELPAAQATVEGESMPTASIDQQTVLVLLIFFMIQLVIYIVCLVKLGSLKRAPVPAQTRITLLENEEPLFDLGLYVGLAGTVISLLMLAMGIVQASLVAAYASTLFGIIFVALLKILHVRPLKRRLILER